MLRRQKKQFRKGQRPQKNRFSNFTSRPKNSGRITYSGNFLTQISTVAGANLIPLNPQNFGALLAQLSTAFLQFRFTKLALRCHPSPSTQSYAVSVSPGLDVTTSTTLAQIMQDPVSAYLASTQTVPQMLLVHRGILMGETSLKWWKVNPGGTYTTVQTTQGLINVVGGAVSTAVQIEIEYTIQLDSADPDLMGQYEQQVWSQDDLRRKVNGDVKTIPVNGDFKTIPVNGDDKTIPHPEFEHFYTLDKEVADLRKYLARVKIQSMET